MGGGKLDSTPPLGRDNVGELGNSCVDVRPVTLNRPPPLGGLPTSESGTVQVIVPPLIEAGTDFFGVKTKYFACVVLSESVDPTKNLGAPPFADSMPT